MATMNNGPPLEALLLTSFQQKKIVRRAVPSDFTLFTLDIAAARQHHCGFVSNSLLFTQLQCSQLQHTKYPINKVNISLS
jgi:hypothetical protein